MRRIRTCQILSKVLVTCICLLSNWRIAAFVQGCWLCREYDDQIQGIHGCEIPVYKTVAGEPAAYAERLPSNLEVKIIRSTRCPLIVKKWWQV